MVLRIEKGLANECDDAHQRLRIGIAAGPRPLRKRNVEGDRRLHHNQAAPCFDNVADLRLLGRCGHVHQRALARDHFAGRQRQHRRDARCRQPRQLGVVHLDGVGGARLRFQDLRPFPALDFGRGGQVLRHLRRRLIGGPRVAEIDQPGIHRQPAAVDDVGFRRDRDVRADGLDDAAPDDNGAGLERRTSGRDNVRTADRVHIRRVGAQHERQRERGGEGDE